MKHSFTSITLGSALLVISTSLLVYQCTPVVDEAISSIKIGGQAAKIFHLENVKDSIDIRLSDLVDDLEFIALETNPKCILNRPDFYVGSDYIISFENRGSIFQFDRAGNFIRPITHYGKGPTEVTNYVWAIDESSHILYIKNLNQDYFLSFDLMNGQYQKEIPLAYKCDIVQFVIPQPGTFLIAPTISPEKETNSYFTFWQDDTGDFLGGVPATAGIKVGYGSQVLFQESKETYYYYWKTDTLFSVDPNKRTAQWVFNLHTTNSKKELEPGSRTIKVLSYQKKYMLCSLFIAESTAVNENISATTGGLFFLYFDMIKEQVNYLNRLMVDPLEQTVRPVSIKTQGNGAVYVRYYALDLKEQIEQTLQESEVDKEKEENLKKLYNRINVEDNPILLVGKVKS